MRLIVATAVVVGMLTTAALAALPPFDTTHLYSEAAFAAAIKPYTDAIAKNANDADAHYWLGVAYLHLTRLSRLGLAPYAADFGSKAIASLERARQLRPASFPVLLALMDAYTYAGEMAKYDATFDRILSLAPPVPPK